MRTVQLPWMVATVRYTKTDENGNDKRVTEKVALSADTYAEAEEKITKEFINYENVDLEITGMVRPTFNEVFFSDDNKDDKFYTAKLSFITIDEATEKEKKTNVTYLVQAATLNGAIKNVDEVMKSSTADYVSISATESKIVDVLDEG